MNLSVQKMHDLLALIVITCMPASLVYIEK